MKIPKIIHYIWVGDPNKKPQQFYDCLASWKKFCPDYEIKEWNESNFDFSDCRYAQEAYQLRKYPFVTDYIRMRVLSEYGGIYLDTDVEITKSFDDLLDNDFLISFENEVHIETAVLGCTKGHPFPKMVAEFYMQYPFIYNNKPDMTPNPMILTYFLRKYYGMEYKNKLQNLKRVDNNGDETITVFPSEYFCPINYTTKEMKKTENTYAIHYFGATWFTAKFKGREKFLKGVYKFFGKRIFSSFTKTYVKSISRRIDKRLKKLEKGKIRIMKKATIAQ